MTATIHRFPTLRCALCRELVTPAQAEIPGAGRSCICRACYQRMISR